MKASPSDEPAEALFASVIATTPRQESHTTSRLRDSSFAGTNQSISNLAASLNLLNFVYINILVPRYLRRISAINASKPL